MEASTLIGDEFYSIGVSGLAFLQGGKISTGIGGVKIELVSAPIPAGEYQMEVHTGIGSIKIYLPRYVQFTIEGKRLVGDQNIHEGTGLWEGMLKSFAKSFHLPNQIPDYVVEPISVEQPITIHFSLNTGIGEVDIYRL